MASLPIRPQWVHTSIFDHALSVHYRKIKCLPGDRKRDIYIFFTLLVLVYKEWYGWLYYIWETTSLIIEICSTCILIFNTPLLQNTYHVISLITHHNNHWATATKDSSLFFMKDFHWKANSTAVTVWQSAGIQLSRSEGIYKLIIEFLWKFLLF